MNRLMRDPDSPWNPKSPVEITPQQFERQVVEWIKDSISSTSDAQITHQAIVPGQGGEYAIDIQARLNLLKGASIDILIECKHQRRSVERDEILILEGKLRDTGAHKGMLFATSGFQKGAISYAKAHGIATITVINGSWLYETRSMNTEPGLPPWVDLTGFAGIFLSPTDGGIQSKTIIPDHLDSLRDFLSIS